MAVVCKTINCPYNRGEICKKDFTFINAAGQCYSLYNKNGQPRAEVYLDAELPVVENQTKPDDAT